MDPNAGRPSKNLGSAIHSQHRMPGLHSQISQSSTIPFTIVKQVQAVANPVLNSKFRTRGLLAKPVNVIRAIHAKGR